MNSKTKRIIIYLSVAVALLYILFIPFARKGFGYMGYYGYYQGPSFWYWGDSVEYYYEKSARNGSVKGTNIRGGGPGRGK